VGITTKKWQTESHFFYKYNFIHPSTPNTAKIPSSSLFPEESKPFS